MLQTLLSRKSTQLSQEEDDGELPEDISLPLQTVEAVQQLETKLNEKATQRAMVSAKQHYFFRNSPICDIVCVCVCVVKLLR